MRVIEHLSGSSMNAYDSSIHDFYTRYVLWEEPSYPPRVREAREFGKQYELNLGEWTYAGWDTQKECEMIIGGYKMYGLFDFYNKEKQTVVECKTKSWWWSKKQIRESWQFRFYNHWCWENGFNFILHEYNKKLEKCDELDVKWLDKTFEQDFLERAGQIERFLKWFNVILLRHDL